MQSRGLDLDVVYFHCKFHTKSNSKTKFQRQSGQLSPSFSNQQPHNPHPQNIKWPLARVTFPSQIFGRTTQDQTQWSLKSHPLSIGRGRGRGTMVTAQLAPGAERTAKSRHNDPAIFGHVMLQYSMRSGTQESELRLHVEQSKAFKNEIGTHKITL